MSKIENAYQMLCNLIACGWEFPDASIKAAEQFGVKIDALRAEYDTRIAE